MRQFFPRIYVHDHEQLTLGFPMVSIGDLPAATLCLEGADTQHPFQECLALKTIARPDFSRRDDWMWRGAQS
jgi:hypothetical protein